MDERRDSLQTSTELAAAAREDQVHAAFVQIVSGFLILGVVVFVSLLLTLVLFESASTVLQALIAAALALLLLMPMTVTMYRVSMRATRRSTEVTAEWEARVNREASRREFEAQVADAFEMAENEPEALRVVERSLGAVLPGQFVELLLADNSHAHLEQLVSVGDDERFPGCPVASPSDCPAARRSRVLEFPDSNAVNACPKLAGRTEEGCSALCMPVSVMGRTVGVIHSVGGRDTEIDRAVVGDLQAIANQAGARLGMLRVLADSQLQASTDGLTGLLNRRALEERYRVLRSRPGPLAVAMADLDHFKRLNDTHGHETGDRALRTFAETLRATVRTEDVVCRHGGEEFALIFPACSAEAAGRLLDRVRAQLSDTVSSTGLPRYTASFGVVDGDPREDLEALLRRADAGLFEAKRLGRDRIVVNGIEQEDFSEPPSIAPVDLDAAS